MAVGPEADAPFAGDRADATEMRRATFLPHEVSGLRPDGADVVLPGPLEGRAEGTSMAPSGSIGSGIAPWSARVLFTLALVAPPLGWLAPQGLAAIAAIAGMATLPELRFGRLGKPMTAVLAAGIAWIWVSTNWGPFPLLAKPMTGLAIAALVPLGVSLISAGRRASAPMAALLPRALVCGAALLAVILFFEAMTAGSLFRAVNAAIGISIRPDLATRDAARGTYVLVVLGPAAIRAGVRLGATKWLVPLLVGCLLFSAHALGADAPIAAVFVAIFAATTVSLRPQAGALALAGGSAALVLAMPLLIWIALGTGRYEAMAARLPLSWAERMSYWRFAVARIAEHPVRGWGMDASRVMAPGFVLHPHNGALQLWLELGLPGALLGAALSGGVFRGLSRPIRDPDAVTGAATAAAYLTIGLVSFGVWQEWWIGLGLIAATLCAALRDPDLQGAPEACHRNRADVVEPASCVVQRVVR